MLRSIPTKIGSPSAATDKLESKTTKSVEVCDPETSESAVASGIACPERPAGHFGASCQAPVCWLVFDFIRRLSPQVKCGGLWSPQVCVLAVEELRGKEAVFLFSSGSSVLFLFPVQSLWPRR